jgi:copper chaperone CopZ
MNTITIGINGMSCGHCVAAVQKALAAVPGVTVDDVRIGSATVTLDATTSRATVESAIDAAGYDVVSGRVLNINAAAKSDAKS